MLVLRPLDRSDAADIAGLYGRLSPRSLWQRFLAPYSSVPAPLLLQLAAIDHTEHEAVGVFDDGVLVASAHYFRAPDDRTVAEVAMEVQDSHQHRGLGTGLLDALVDLAGSRGITTFTATCSAENRAVRGLLRHSGSVQTVTISRGEMSITAALVEHGMRRRPTSHLTSALVSLPGPQGRNTVEEFQCAGTCPTWRWSRWSVDLSSSCSRSRCWDR